MEPVLRARPAPCRCALVASLLVPALARAESVDTHYGEEIEVTVHYENAVGTSAAAWAGRFTSRLAEARPILSPGEVLDLVPGLVITQHSEAGKGTPSV